MTESAPFQLQVKGLQCERGENVLFSDLNFEINPGELHLLEGINGSGKTTLLRTIAGYTLPYAGTISWQSKPASLNNPEYNPGPGYANPWIPIVPGPADPTVKAIRAFQSRFLSSPDGRVDPYGRTWRELTNPALGAGPAWPRTRDPPV